VLKGGAWDVTTFNPGIPVLGTLFKENKLAKIANIHACRLATFAICSIKKKKKTLGPKWLKNKQTQTHNTQVGGTGTI